MDPHNFEQSLAASHAAEDLPLWEEVYRKAFPSFATMVNHRKDGDHQRNGIDRSVILENSKQILIDEKIRGRNKRTGKIYKDIALEYLSDEKRGVPGWVCKPLLCDYIAYAIGPLGVCYLLPVLELQSVWESHCELWKQKYPFEIRAKNEDRFTGRKWTTLSVGVPPEDIFRALRIWQTIFFERVEM